LLRQACKARHATWAVCRAKQQPAGAHTLPAPRPLANACLCEALVRQARGSFDFCVVLLKNNTAALATALRGDRAGMSSGTSAAAAGRGPSDAAPAAPSGRLIFIGQVYSRRSGAHTRGILPFGPDTPSRGPRPLRLAQGVLKSLKNLERFPLDSILKFRLLRCNRPT
jgi:hypothetical protein